jgi:integrase/recombinase XerC
MFAEYLPAFYNFANQRNIAQKTLSSLKQQLEKFAKEFKTENSLVDIRAQELSDYVVGQCKGKSAHLFKAKVWAIRQLFSYLVIKGVIRSSPADVLKHARFPNREKLPSFLRANEMNRLLEVASVSDNQADFVLVALLLVSGLRSSEIANCSRSAYDPKQGLIRVKVKGDWIREVALTDEIIGVIDCYLSSRNDLVPSLLLPPRGGFCTTAWVQKTLRRLGQCADFDENLTSRLLRHTFGTHAADRLGTDMTRTLMGHSVSSSTNVYMHMSPSYYRPISNSHPYLSH